MSQVPICKLDLGTAALTLFLHETTQWMTVPTLISPINNQHQTLKHMQVPNADLA